MKETRRKVGLHTIVTTEAPFEPPTTAQRLAKWAEDIDRRGAEVLGDNMAPESVKVFAERCHAPAVLVLKFLRKANEMRSLSADDVANAMEAAADLQDEWSSLVVEDSLLRPMQGAIAASEGGRKGATARHARDKKHVERRWEKVIAHARTLNATGRSRKEILDAVAKKAGVKTSTLIKNPGVRAHLPASRRKSRG